MEEDTIAPEPSKVVEDKDRKIKRIEYDITQNNDIIVELVNDFSKIYDDISDIKREANDLKSQVRLLEMD